MTRLGGPGYSPLVMNGLQYRGAFVVQFRSGTDVEAGQVEGRVEHVASLKATHFGSVEELLVFVAAVLAEADADDGQERS